MDTKLQIVSDDSTDRPNETSIPEPSAYTSNWGKNGRFGAAVQLVDTVDLGCQAGIDNGASESANRVAQYAGNSTRDRRSNRSTIQNMQSFHEGECNEEEERQRKSHATGLLARCPRLKHGQVSCRVFIPLAGSPPEVRRLQRFLAPLGCCAKGHTQPVLPLDVN